MAPMFIDLARAFLSIQASSAAAERLFGDAGYNEGFRRQNNGDTVTEMLLVIRSFLMSHIENARSQTSFLSARSQSIVNLTDEICSEMDKATH